MAQELEDAFYHEGRLEPAEWQALAQTFERNGRRGGQRRRLYTQEWFLGAVELQCPPAGHNTLRAPVSSL